MREDKALWNITDSCIDEGFDPNDTHEVYCFPSNSGKYKYTLYEKDKTEKLISGNTTEALEQYASAYLHGKAKGKGWLR